MKRHGDCQEGSHRWVERCRLIPGFMLDVATGEANQSESKTGEVGERFKIVDEQSPLGWLLSGEATLLACFVIVNVALWRMGRMGG